MPPRALSEDWTDVYTAGGFWFGAAGLVVGVLGFGYTIHQVRKTQSAVLAAEETARRVLTESRSSFARFVAGQAHRLLNDLRAAVAGQDWRTASGRAYELADLVAHLQQAPGPEVSETVRGLRDFARTFGDKVRTPGKRYAVLKWDRLLQDVAPLLDRLQAPFGTPPEGAG